MKTRFAIAAERGKGAKPLCRGVSFRPEPIFLGKWAEWRIVSQTKIAQANLCTRYTSRILTTLLLLFTFHFSLFTPLCAQQEAQYSQYMFNNLFINPAYAGARDHASMALIGRNQWTGFDGAPKSAAFSLHGPSANLKNGFGMMLTTDAIGPISTSGLSLQYAYRIKIDDEHTLAFGLQGALDYYRTNFSSLRIENTADHAFTGQDVRRFLPNAGAGAFFNGQLGYVGFAVPRLLSNRLSPTVSDSGAHQARHFFLTGGFVFNLLEAVKFRPSVLLKASTGGGPNLDINASFLFKEKLWLGASWRSEDALIFMAEFWPTQQLRIGYAYDLSTSALRRYNSGTHELSLGFDFAFKKGNVVSPRYF
jgi:type IX secretion system PorP/SprF family membrane protein